MDPIEFIRKKIQDREYSELETNLRSMRVSRSPHKYAAKAIFYSLVLAFVMVPVSFLLLYFFVGPAMLDYVKLPINLGIGYLSKGMVEFLYIIAAIIIGTILGSAMYLVFMFYPQISASNREKGIEDMLPHATAYMLALSKGGFEPIEIFDSLSEQTEYGEISREAGAIARNSKVLGYSPTDAMEDVAETTPSEEFEDFLTSFASVIETGTNKSEFLRRRSNEYYDEAKEKQERNLEFLGILSEVYVTSLGLGPIFGVIMLILFGMMGPFRTNILYLIVYVGIPFGTGIFIVILDMQSRTEFGENEPTPEENKSFQQAVQENVTESMEKLGSVESLIMSPPHSLWISLPIASIITLLLFQFLTLRIETLITAFAIVSLTPVSILFEIKSRREGEMINLAPDFLYSFSDLLKSGLSPFKALTIMKPEKYGILGKEIQNIRKDIEWGNSVTEAFQRSANRIEIRMISRVMSLIKKTSEVASETSEILEVLARDVETERNLQIERNNVTTTYAIIVFLTFGIFLLTAYNIANSLVPLMSRMSESQTASGGQALGQIGGIEPALIETVFFRASLIQGFFSGILAGMMKRGTPYAGLKFSLIMLTIAWAFFTFLGF